MLLRRRRRRFGFLALYTFSPRWQDHIVEKPVDVQMRGEVGEKVRKINGFEGITEPTSCKA